MVSRKRKIMLTAIYGNSGGLPYPSTGLAFGPPTSNTGLSLMDSKGIEATFVNSNCLTFDGTDDRVDLKNKITWFDNTTNTWTVEFYGNITTGAATATILSNKFGTPGFSIERIATNKIRLYMRKSGTTDELIVDSTNSVVATAGIYYKVMISYDGSKSASGVKIYINDAPETNVVSVNTLTSTDISTGCLTTTIGCYQQTATPTYLNFLAGRVFGIRIRNTVQTPGTTAPADLLDLPMACGNGNICCDRSASANPGLMTNFNLATCWNTKQQVFHENITRGFVAGVKGDKVTGYVRINAYKNRGTGNFWHRIKFVCNSPYATSSEGLSGNMTGSSADERYGFYFGNTNKLTHYFDLGALSAPLIQTDTLVVGQYYDAIVNIDRAGLASFYLNGVLQSTVDISSQVGNAFVATYDYYLLAAATTGGGPATFSNQTILEASSGTGLIDPLNPNATTPDVYKFVATPDNAGFIETITGTQYVATAGTLYNVKMPSSNATPTKDVFGNTLQYPAGVWHNGAETQLDWTIKPTLQSNSKYIKCLTNTAIGKATTQAYGTWEIDLDLRQGATFRRELFNAYFLGTNNGYGVEIGTNMGIALYRKDGGAITYLSTSNLTNFYFTPYERYTLKVTRNSVLNEFVTGAVGTFAMYIKGGKFGTDFVLTDSSVTGTNPVTDNTYTNGTGFTSFIGPTIGDVYGNYKLNGVLIDMSTYITATAGLLASYLYRTYQDGMLSVPTTVKYITGSTPLYRYSTQSYGEWSFDVTYTSPTHYFCVTSDSVTPGVNCYCVYKDSGNGLGFRKFVSSASTQLIPATYIVPVDGTKLRVRVRRNQTLNQYFTGAANAFELSYQAGASIGGASRTVIGVSGADTAFLTSTYCTISNMGTYRNVTFNGVIQNIQRRSGLSASRRSYITNFQFRDLTNNPIFKRDVFKYIQLFKHDRFLIYATNQVVPALTKITNYIKDLFI